MATQLAACELGTAVENRETVLTVCGVGGGVQIWGEEALQFQEKLLNSSGLGDETYFPDSERPPSPLSLAELPTIALL